MPEILRVRANSTIQKVIDIVDASSAVRIELEHGSAADIVIHIHGDAPTMDHAADVTVGPEARCTVLTINDAGATSSVSIKQQGSIADGGSLRWQNITLGGGDMTHDLTSHAVGNDAESAVDWMFYAKGTERQHLHVRNMFGGRNGRGEVLMRGVAEGKGHAEAHGLIDIGLHGSGTDTYLTQNVLMLDPTAKVDAIPALEIKTNDVKASHSATVARVTAEDLFYFGARGIDQHEARAMFVQGFLGDITSRIGEKTMREKVERMIEEKYMH